MVTKRTNPFTLIALPILMLILFPCCMGFRPESSAPPRKSTRALIPPDRRHPLTTDAYSAAHSFYCGLIIPLDLTGLLPLEEKYRILKALFSSGATPQGSDPLTIRIPGYFSRNDLIIRSVYDPDPPRIHWRSNAVYSPIVGGPLRGKGEFLPEKTRPGNISDMVLLHEHFAVRITEINTRNAESYYRRRRDYNNLADLYIHDGIPENDRHILPLLQRAYEAAASPLHRVVVELTAIQRLTALRNYEEAEKCLRKLIPVLPSLSPEVRHFFRYSYEEYALARTFDTEDREYLVEYDRFLNL